MSLSIQFFRWIFIFSVVSFICTAVIYHALQNQDRRQLLHIQASQILDLTFHLRTSLSADASDANTGPQCKAAKHFNTNSRSPFTVKDLSLRPQNPINYPSVQERGVLATLSSDINAPASSGTMIIDGAEWFFIARPISFQPECLNCHEKIKSTGVPLVDGAAQVSPKPVFAATIVYIDFRFLHTERFFLFESAYSYLAACFLLLITALRIVFGRIVLQPLAMSALALERLAADPSSPPQVHPQVPYELERLHRACHQLGRELLRAQTSLKDGLKDLEDEENRFKSLTQSATDAIITADEDGLVSSWNRGAERLFGYREGEIVGKSVTLLVPPKNLPAHLNGYASAVATGGTRLRGESVELQGVHKNGHMLAVELSLSGWSLAGRQHFSAIIRDISRRKKNAARSHREFMSRVAINSILEVAIKPLSLNEKLTKSLQIILAVPWLSLKYKGAIFLLNTKSGKLEMAVEYGLSERIKSLCKEISIGQCLCGRAASTQKLIFSGHLDKAHTVQFEGMGPHGHYCVPIMVEHRLLGVINLYLQDGHEQDIEEMRFLEMVSQTLAGIIDRKTAERQLRYLSQAIEQSPVSVVITDAHGIIEYVNSACCKISGYERNELIGNKPKILKSGELPDSIYKSLWKTILSGEVWRGELHNRKKNGETFWEDASISPVRFENNEIRYFLAVKEDITQRKILENSLADLLSTLDVRVKERTQELNAKVSELEHTRHELLESEKMASLGRLVAGFAHEINTPIGVAVTGFSLAGEALYAMENLLQQEEVHEEDLHESMSTIREACELALANLTRAGELVASFKRTSVDQSFDVQRVFHVREIVEDVIRSLHNRIKKTRIEILVTIDPSLKIMGWPGTLDQILTNFIINSLTYAYTGENPEGQITINAYVKDNRMFLDYSDDGCGMEESVRSLAFEPFFTTGRAQGGSGLGLYLCYNIVTSKLNGTISCESSPGQGVRFPVSFPVKELTI